MNPDEIKLAKELAERDQDWMAVYDAPSETLPPRGKDDPDRIVAVIGINLAAAMIHAEYVKKRWTKRPLLGSFGQPPALHGLRAGTVLYCNDLASVSRKDIERYNEWYQRFGRDLTFEPIHC